MRLFRAKEHIAGPLAPSVVVGNLTVAYRTSVEAWQQLSADQQRQAAALGLPPMRPVLPYAIDVWSPKKVLSLQWGDLGEIDIISWKRGAWESELLNAARSSGGSRGVN